MISPDPVSIILYQNLLKIQISCVILSVQWSQTYVPSVIIWTLYHVICHYVTWLCRVTWLCHVIQGCPIYSDDKDRVCYLTDNDHCVTTSWWYNYYYVIPWACGAINMYNNILYIVKVWYMRKRKSLALRFLPTLGFFFVLYTTDCRQGAEICVGK